MKAPFCTMLCASLLFAACAQANEVNSARPSMEVSPGVTVSANDISTTYTDIGTGDITFLGNVVIEDGSSAQHVPWATFSPIDSTLVAGSEAGEVGIRANEYCLNGAYWLYGEIRAYPTRANPYRRPISPPALLYCEGNLLRYI